MDGFYHIERFDGYYRIGSAESVFSYLVVGTERAMLIDTGYGLGDLPAAVASLTTQPLIIVNTHGHCDHVGGNALFDAPCYIHPADMELARDHTKETMRRDNAERLARSVNYETGETYNALPAGFDAKSYAALGAGELTPAHGGMRFNLGGATMELIETPGHTAGGLSVLYREKGLLFIGDATGFFVWLFGRESTDKSSYLRMLDKIDELPVSSYLGGHNPNVMTREDLPLYRRAALEADYEKGTPFASFFEQDRDPRVCAVDGMGLNDMFSPGFSAVVIAPDWH